MTPILGIRKIMVFLKKSYLSQIRPNANSVNNCYNPRD